MQTRTAVSMLSHAALSANCCMWHCCCLLHCGTNQIALGTLTHVVLSACDCCCCCCMWCCHQCCHMWHFCCTGAQSKAAVAAPLHVALLPHCHCHTWHCHCGVACGTITVLLHKLKLSCCCCCAAACLCHCQCAAACGTVGTL